MNRISKTSFHSCYCFCVVLQKVPGQVEGVIHQLCSVNYWNILQNESEKKSVSVLLKQVDWWGLFCFSPCGSRSGWLGVCPSFPGHSVLCNIPPLCCWPAPSRLRAPSWHQWWLQNDAGHRKCHYSDWGSSYVQTGRTHVESVPMLGCAAALGSKDWTHEITVLFSYLI